MNLAFNFLKYLHEQEQKQLSSIKLKGNALLLLNKMNAQIATNTCNRAAIQKELKLSDSHFDKLSSELLSAVYAHLFGNHALNLLRYLSEQSVYVKHFYAELKRQLKQIAKEPRKETKATFYYTCFNYILQYMPAMYKDEAVLKKLGALYLQHTLNKNAVFLIDIKLVQVKIERLFAAAKMAGQKEKIAANLKKLEKHLLNANEEEAFTYYWTKLYYYNAIEDFHFSLSVSREAIDVLRKYKSKQNSINLFRLELKVAELLYYISSFDESFKAFDALMQNPLIKEVPDQGYYNTKFLQICLITDKLKRAKQIITANIRSHTALYKNTMLPRDLISCAKYYLFSGEYNKAFEFIQLGFEKNPKAKYFQYEIELRNLQTAYFFLSGQREVLPALCNRNLKFLRSHNYSAKQSDFPHFYMLTKTLLRKAPERLSASEQQMLKRYQKGSYGVYGKLLLKMMAAA